MTQDKLIIKSNNDIGLFMIKYGLVVIYADQKDNPKAQVLHFCGYEKQPTPLDIENLRVELTIKIEFGLTHEMDKIIIIDAPAVLIDAINNGILTGSVG